jgi:hypothetical protein
MHPRYRPRCRRCLGCGAEAAPAESTSGVAPVTYIGPTPAASAGSDPLVTRAAVGVTPAACTIRRELRCRARLRHWSGGYHNQVW